jgi:hypothetical protein
MSDVMVVSLPILSSYGLIRRVRVSLPPLSKTDAQLIGRQRLYHRPRSPPRVTAVEWRAPVKKKPQSEWD